MSKSIDLKTDQKSIIDLAYRAATNTELFFNRGCGDYEYLEELTKIYYEMPGLKNIEIKWPSSPCPFEVQNNNLPFLTVVAAVVL